MDNRSFLLKKRVLLLASTVLALVLCELLVRLFVPVRNVGPATTVPDPYYGKRQKKSFSCTRKTPDVIMQFTTNSLGFRGPEPATLPRDGILFLGDSFTMGYGVNDGDEFPAIVRRGLDERYGNERIPVVNAGLAGNGNGRWIKFMKADMEDYRPRVVVLQICGNDFVDNMAEAFYGLDANGGIVELPMPPETAGMKLKRHALQVIDVMPFLAYSYTVGLANQLLSEGGHQEGGTHDPHTDTSMTRSLTHAEQLTFALIEEAIRICEERNIPLIALAIWAEGRRLAELTDIFRRHGIPFLATPAKRERPDLFHRIDGHWNATGHVMAANWILEHVLADSTRLLGRLELQSTEYDLNSTQHVSDPHHHPNPQR